MKTFSRREATKSIACFTLGTAILPALPSVGTNEMTTRKIPSSGQPLPVVGLGTWQTFDVGNDSAARERLSEVLTKMKEKGGKVIDSSPMYGSSEQVVGDLTSRLGIQDDFFYATKVWTSGKQAGQDQMESSLRKMKREKIDLMQIHNLIDWQTHLKTLKDWKELGKINYWGITHYTDASHDTLARIIKEEQPDFVQFNYSINRRNAEISLLRTAEEHGTAVILNRPFDGGSLFSSVRGKILPDWCKELGINSWAQYFLKYLLADEAVNCAIPGTSKPKHVVDNMMAGYGRLPTQRERQKMLDYLKTF
ncbi:aldo/keto reductase [Flavobacteriaceae bacterium TP-CH-4]|uniref:Aldo/keto reductase n=1 Tax=Pelagihabitans pacificus TaxID=2696054 RepID=A0A967AV02_9FLAO|nr:aldo/keto reductase [Pelagihabitans pacificus]NHF59533.1 aldo/keto reductase [Pelagihabitans pacificus]